KGHASLLREEFLRANFAGMFAKELARASKRDTEEVFICAMFHNLGRLLAQYYFPEEAAEIQRRLQVGDGGEAQASARVLGISYEDLGIGIARNWGLPEPLVQSMRTIPAREAVRPAANREERLRVLAACSDAVCRVIEHGEPASRNRDLSKVQGRFADSLAVSDEQLRSALDAAVVEVTEFAAILRVNLRQMRLGKQLLQGAAETGESATSAAQVSDFMADAVLDAQGGYADDGTATGLGLGTPGPRTVDAQAILAAGIQDISNSLVDEFSLNDVLRIILETIYRALGFQRVLLCVRDGRTQTMIGRLALGLDADTTAKKFRFPLGGTADVFNIVLAKGVDLLVHDAAESKIAGRVPDWYRKAVGAPTFILLPLAIRGSAVALIYADKDKPNDIVISEKELTLLRTLRNQAVLAIKQSR
ncbi:MAG: HDOD domain-containing protein, partial [Rhodocyclaceae bacterium]